MTMSADADDPPNDPESKERPQRLRFRVIPAESGRALGSILRKRLPAWPGREVLELIRAGGVYINALRVRMQGVRVMEGERITVHLDAHRHAQLDPSQLDIVARGADYMVIDKPPGVPTSATKSRARGTIAQAALDLLLSEKVPRPFIGIVLGLDTAHSGLVLLTYRSAVSTSVHNAFLDMPITRHYILRARVPERHRDAWRDGKLDCHAQVVAQRGGALRLAREHEPVATPLAAHTCFIRLGRLGRLDRLDRLDEASSSPSAAETSSLLRAEIQHGRSPQLSLHLDAMGMQLQAHPDDERFSCLHAELLEFVHPSTGERISLRSPRPKWAQDRP